MQMQALFNTQAVILKQIKEITPAAGEYRRVLQIITECETIVITLYADEANNLVFKEEIQ